MENQEIYNIEPGVKEVVITHRKGLDELAPKSVDIGGIIDSPYKWLEKRPEVNNKGAAHILIDRKKMSITLIDDQHDPYSQDMICGKLEYHPDYKKWLINTGESWNHKSLSEFIKMNRSCFSDKQVAMKLSSDLRDLKVKADKEVEMSNDNRGNVKAMAVQKIVENSLPKTFSLVVPVFKGTDKKEFEVELYVNPDTFQVTLVSPDANDIRDAIRDSVIDQEIKKIEGIAPTIPIIEV